MNGPDPASAPYEPRRVGRYEIHGPIAAGGMAVVHLGRLLGEGGFARTVAIKRLHAQYAQTPEFTSRFLAEARLAARVRHRNVVATLDAVAAEGELLLVMEYIVGESLAGLQAASAKVGEKMPLSIALRIAADALYGLDAAHRATGEDQKPLRIVHRDVSPQNILVGVDGMARVLDFGIAKAESMVHTTREGQLKGKLRYMAPEQINDEALSARTDVYGLSVTLWELLTGERLFAGTNDAAIMAKILSAPVVKPSRLAPEIPALIDEIVLRGLSRDPSHRFASAHEMAVALESARTLAFPSEVGDWVSRVAEAELAARARSVGAIEHPMNPELGRPAPPVDLFPPTDTHTATVSTPDRVVPARRRSPWRRVAQGAAVVAALVVGGALLMRLSAERRPPANAAAEAPIAAAAAASPAPPIPSAPTSPSAVSEVASSQAPPLRRARPQPSIKTSPSGTRPESPPSRSCSPPYLEDAMGIRHIKPECLSRP